MRKYAALAFLLIEMSSAAAEEPSGKLLFESRCAVCHQDASNGLPAKSTIASYPRDRIVGAMLDGEMKVQASGFSVEEIHAVADYLEALKPGRAE